MKLLTRRKLQEAGSKESDFPWVVRIVLLIACSLCWGIGELFLRALETHTGLVPYLAGWSGIPPRILVGLTVLLWLGSFIATLAAPHVKGMRRLPDHRSAALTIYGLLAGFMLFISCAFVAGGIASLARAEWRSTALEWAPVLLGAGMIAVIVKRLLPTPLTYFAVVFTAIAVISASEVKPTASRHPLLTFAMVPITLSGCLVSAWWLLARRYAKEDKEWELARQAEAQRKATELAEANRQAAEAEAARQRQAAELERARAKAAREAEQTAVAEAVAHLPSDYSWWLGDDDYSTYFQLDWTFEHVRDRDSWTRGHSYITHDEQFGLRIDHYTNDDRLIGWTDEEGQRHVIMSNLLGPGGDKVWPFYRRYLAAYREFHDL